MPVYTNPMARSTGRGGESSVADIADERFFPSAESGFDHCSRLELRNRLTVSYYGRKAHTWQRTCDHNIGKNVAWSILSVCVVQAQEYCLLTSADNGHV